MIQRYFISGLLMAKKIGLVSVSCLGLTSIIGSGWLFASYRAAPAAIFRGSLLWGDGIMGFFDFHRLAHENSAAVIFTFVIIALFDSRGALLGLVKQFPDQVQKQTRRINRALLAESLATCFA